MRHSATSPFLALCTILGALALSTTSPQAARAENWPAWRGNGSGITTEKNLSVEWDAKTNILWKISVPGQGNSSPIIWNNHITLNSSLDDGKKRLVLCYNAADGQEAWRREFSVAAPTKSYPKNGFASHTPATDGEHVYAFFDDPGLIALDAKTGTIAWQLPLGPFRQGGYFAASPLLAADLVIMVCDVDQSTYNGAKHKGGFIVAVDKLTGIERWRTPRKPSWNAASPIAINIAGKIQIIVSGDPVIAYDAQTGEEIWSCTGMKPMCAPSPVFDGSLLWVASGRNGPAMTIDPTGKGDVTETHATLLTDTGGPYVPSPLVYPFLMLPGDDGQINFLDKSGQLLLRTRLPGHFSASPIGAENHIYWPDEEGRTYVLDAAQLAAHEPRAAIIAINDLGEPILASPAISNGRLYLRSTSNLYCIAGSARTTPPIAATSTQPAPTLEQLNQRYQQFHALEGPDIAVRLQVVDDLAALKDPEATTFLLTIVQKDNHWDVSEAAAKALAHRGVPATDALLALLDDKREYPRIIAAGALGEMQTIQAAPKLTILASDKNRFVRLAALRALGRIGQSPNADPEIILPSLTTGLSDPDSPVKIAAIQALSALPEKAGNHRQEIIQQLQLRAADKNLGVAKAAAETLLTNYKPQPDPTSRPITPPAKP